MYGLCVNTGKQIKQARAEHEEEHAAMLEIVQTKAEELLRREEEGKTMRLLYESEVNSTSLMCSRE